MYTAGGIFACERGINTRNSLKMCQDMLLGCRSGGSNYNRGFSVGGGYSSGYYRSPFSMWFSPFDLFYYWSPGYPARQRQRLERGEGYNFLESIFSFGAPALCRFCARVRSSGTGEDFA